MLDLFKNLMSICDDSGGKFYYKDFNDGFQNLRVFSYHYASYSDWLKPNALDCRGIMFSIDENGGVIDLVSRPMKKFFNLNENPLSMSENITNCVSSCHMKADGSLISTYSYGDSFRLKSKTSISSKQALDSWDYLNSHPILFKFLQDCTEQGYTVNMEWCSPCNRIVLDYKEPELTILNLVCKDTGKVQTINFSEDSELYKYSIKPYEINLSYGLDDIRDEISALEGIEGVILGLTDNTFIKIKTDWYVNLHNHKDSVNNNKELAKTMIMGNDDDLLALFHDDPASLDKISEFKEVFGKLSLKYYLLLGGLVTQNRDLSRKDYAILGQEKVPKFLFSAYMNQYDGLDEDNLYNDFKKSCLRNIEEFIPDKYKG